VSRDDFYSVINRIQTRRFGGRIQTRRFGGSQIRRRQNSSFV